MMENIKDDKLKKAYEPPQIIDRQQLEIELQTNVLPDEPPPPM